MLHFKRAFARILCGASLAASSFAYAAPELSVYRWDAPGGPGNIDAYSQWLGRPVAVAGAFEATASWDDIDGADWQLGPWANWVRAQPGRNLALAIPMLPPSGASLASCASGQYDQYWRNLANNLAYYGLHWAYLRLGWEMDGPWNPWAAPQGSGKEASFAGCFRRVVTVMRQTQPASQWKFVFNPTTSNWSAPWLDAVWPGDAYVDAVGLDIYDQSWAANTYPYPSTCDSACRLTRQQTAWNDLWKYLSAVRNFALAHGKTVALPEWGVAVRSDGHGGGDNPYYIQKMYDFIADPANNVSYYSYFDVRYSGWDSQLSPTSNFPQSASLFKQLFGASMTSTGNTAPTVSITSPASGQTVSGIVNYAANATDNAGVSRVDFFIDSTALLSDTAAPYAGNVDTTKLANGTHVLKAIAYDAQGLSAMSQVSINVQNTVSSPSSSGPTVSFKAPASGGTISGFFSNSSACEVTGTGIAKVVFFLDSTQLNTETASPWNCSIDTRLFSNGTHTLKAVAYNSAGTSTSVSEPVIVQNGTTTTSGSGPSVYFKAPVSGGTISGSFSNSSACEVAGAGIVKVVFFLDGTQLNTETAAPWNCSIDTRKFANGTHTLKATAYNSAGASTTVTEPVNVKN